MAQVFGVCLLPATNEFAYDTVSTVGARWNPTGGYFSAGALETPVAINTYCAPGGAKTDYSYAIDQLQAAHPECATVAVVCAWFGSSTDASTCKIYPSTTYIKGAFQQWTGSGFVGQNWQCSGLTQANNTILIPISQASDGSFVYGGTPSDQSMVRCIQDLKSRGFRVVFYPFILMDCSGEPWRGRITLSSDGTSATTSAVNAFLGSAAPSQFARDTTNLTVSYSGALNDWTYRRMILHYANLCVIAGGVDLFVLGSELRGLECLRGPGWTKAGTTDAGGHAVWDYPFVAGLVQLAADVRGVFDGAGLTKNLSTWKNLITYSPDWSVWNGYQHPGQNGQWPHLDSLFASSNIDVVSFDNYLPLSDWTLGGGGLDCVNWTQPAPTIWPPSTATMNGLGLSGFPTLYSAAYLSANIESGEQFNWYYNSGTTGGVGLDPLGSGQYCTLPQGDRVSQARNPYYANQQLLGRKQFRWWWNNTHRAIYDAADGLGWAPHGPATQWAAQSKPLIFVEYGFATVDRCTNQPNVFYSPKSSESFTPFWSQWESTDGATLTPVRDDLLASMGLQAIYNYWSTATNIPTSGAGVPMLLPQFCCAWNWDARPFPTFPLSSNWGDDSQWPAGNWIGGKGPALAPPASDAQPGPGAYSAFPTLLGQSWDVKVTPRFSTRTLPHSSGRESRLAAMTSPLYDIEIGFDCLRADASYGELQQLLGFIASHGGQRDPFLLPPPGGLGIVANGLLGTGDGAMRSFILTRTVGTYSEKVQALVAAPTIYQNGILVSPAAYVVTILPATVTFASPPASGAVLTASFSSAFLARFVDDSEELENFMSGLWQVKSLKLETVRA